MQSILAAVTSGAALLCLAYAALARRLRPVPTGGRAAAWDGWRAPLAFTAILAVLLFLLALPRSKPFEPGLTLGWGFLLGAALGLYVLFDGSTQPAAEPGIRPLAAAALGPAVLLLLFRGYPTPALAGCALGAAFSAACLLGLLRPFVASRSARPPGLRGLELYALSTAGATAGAWLGILRYPRPDPGAAAGGYWVLPPLALAVGALVLIIVGAAEERTERSALLGGVLAAAVTIGVLGVLQWKLLPRLDAWSALWGPLAVAFLVVAFRQEERAVAESGEAIEGHRPILFALAAAALAAVAAALAFRQMHGYGEALTACVGAIMLAPLAQNDPATDMERASLAEPLARGALAVMLLLAWLRVFLEGTTVSGALDFQQQYNLLSALFGVALAFGAMAFTERGILRVRTAGEFPRALYGRVVLLGLIVTAAPLVAAALWGDRAVAALLGGLVLGAAVWMLVAAWSTGRDRALALAGAPHVLLLSVALVGAILAPIISAMELTRAVKVWIVAGAAVLALVWLFVDAWAGVRAPREVRDETVA